MKKISFFALAACALAFNACNGDDTPDTPKTRIETISFEDCEFAANKSDNTGAYNEEIAYEEFGAAFAHWNYYNMYGGAVIGGSADTSADGSSQSSHLRVNGDAAGEETGSVSFALGDYRDGKEFVCEDWTKVDLAALGTVNKVVITVDASNASGLVGAEATAGFSVCLDQIEFEVPAGE